MTTTVATDVCIVGAGAAGLQAAFQLRQKGLSVALLERGDGVGTFFRNFPRQRNLISINKVHTGLSDAEAKLRYDWNSLLGDETTPLFTSYSKKYFPKADVLVSYMEDYAKALSDVIHLNTDVAEIARADAGYVVTAQDGRRFEAHQIIVSTGVTEAWLPEIDGLELIEQYTTYDPTPERFDDKRVLILGKGNAAFETAESLIEHAQAIHVMSPQQIKFAWNSHFVGHVRAVNTNFIDTYQLKSQNAVIDAEVKKITQQEDGTYVVEAQMAAASGHTIVLQYDHVIGCTGFRFNPGVFAEDIRPDVHRFDKFPKMTPNWEHETAKGIWFAGTLMQSLDFKKTMSGFIHGFRHNITALVEFILARHNGGAIPTSSFTTDRAAMVEEVIDRFSVSAGLFLQPGFLADCYALAGPHAGQKFTEMPYGWLQESVLPEGEYVTATLEFGDFGENPLHVKRAHTAFEGAPDPFIHPVLRYWKDGILVHQRHLSDSLDADWRSFANRDAGAGTVTAMTYSDEGVTQAPADTAVQQATRFFQEVEDAICAQRTAAE